MWNDPAALDRLSGLLLTATLLFAFWIAGRQAAETWLPVRGVVVHGAVHQETRKGVAPILAGLSGGLFSLDLEAARRGFEALPWVRTATLRRQWPDRLVVELAEQTPAAGWNDVAMVNAQGEVFPVSPLPGLPRFHAPDGTEREVMLRYRTFATRLADQGWHIDAVHVDARHAWRLDLAGGVTVDLGRDHLDERLQRFVTFYPLVMAKVADIRRVDMRYPNGFAVQGAART